MKKLIAILFCASLFILSGCNTDVTDPLDTNQTTGNNGGNNNNNNNMQ